MNDDPKPDAILRWAKDVDRIEQLERELNEALRMVELDPKGLVEKKLVATRIELSDARAFIRKAGHLPGCASERTIMVDGYGTIDRPPNAHAEKLPCDCGYAGLIDGK